ncbi:hypothetical protein [Hyphococcus sp.]|uniref:hypothetical protein n=1 Tax=Hyphococcus sp. TaxID=2038636 RepID=UPI003CCC0B16
MSNGFGGEEIKQESSWRYPLGIFMATLVLCAIFLYYYVGPSVDDFSGNTPSPAITEEPVRVEIGGITFSPAANYTVFPRARRGGARDEVVLYALWPTMNGYTPAQRREFIENEPDSRRIDIVISKSSSMFSERDRFERLYLPETLDQSGVRTPYQLTKFNFREQRSNVPTNGYSDTELFVGTDADENLAAIFCFKELDEVKSPECWREYEYGETIEVSYRFKRPYLPEWQALDAAVRKFVEGLDQTSVTAGQ